MLLLEELWVAVPTRSSSARVLNDLQHEEKVRYKADFSCNLYPASGALNSKFVNNMLPEWSRFITEVKLNRGLKESNFDQLYAYLKQHEVHANENRTMMERFLQPTNDPLALVSNASVQQYPTQSSKSPQPSNDPSPADNFQLDQGSSSTENLIESLSNSLALLTQSYKSHLPQTNNQLRTSSNARNKATVQDGRVVVQDVRGRYNANNQEHILEKTIPKRNVVAGNGGVSASTRDAKPMNNTYYVVDSDADYTSNSNIIPYDQYVEDNKDHVVQRNVSSVRNDALMSILDEMHEQGVQKARVLFHSDSVKPKVLAPGMYAIDVKPIPHPLKNNRSAHLNYISHLKESVETVREIVEEEE
ncbi:hypothetical protein Tco_0861362 [Tanacetum coccineum]|uniref:Integrase, catalytic region, zinc finger, CCHC-type, peptidase aspartic, catalytic n=1 Tax=Tanacetum coccineum TaxID=301880 RepID=A0ABQ5BHK2_9ASTR